MASGISLILITIFAALRPSPAVARILPAPTAGYEQSGSRPSDTSPTDAIVRRLDLKLIAPIPARLLGGMFILAGDYHREWRRRDGVATAATDDVAQTPATGANAATATNDVLGVGGIYLHHAKEGAPRFYVVGERFADRRFAGTPPPMHELVLGADIDDRDAPWQLKLDATDDADTRLELRVRCFPGFQRWQPAIGHAIVQRRGGIIDVLLPDHIILGWSFGEDAWRVYGGVRRVSRAYPFAAGTAAFDIGGGSDADAAPDAAGWYDGDTWYALLGSRRRLFGPLHVTVEAGAQRELGAYYDVTGHELGRRRGNILPYGRLALEAWLAQP